MAAKIYNVHLTDNKVKPIKIPRRVFIRDIADITLIGKRTREYGQVFNENLVHMLEHFACPASPTNIEQPDPANKLYEILERPLIGQLWYNSTSDCVHTWTGTYWREINGHDSVHGNSGFAVDGERVPIPTNQFGALHNIDDCAISVSPIFMDSSVESFECSISPDGIITSKYTPIGGVQKSGYAHYAILCYGPCELPPTYLELISVDGPTILERFASATLTATVEGDITDHSVEWRQTGGPSVTFVQIDEYTIQFTANGATAGTVEFTYFIDRGTPIEQRKSLTVEQLGELIYLTSHSYGLNKYIESLSPMIGLMGGMLRIVPPPYAMEPENITSSIGLRGGYLTSTLLTYDSVDEMLSPVISLTGGELKVSLIATTMLPEIITSSLALTGGELKVSLIATTMLPEIITSSLALTGGSLIVP